MGDLGYNIDFDDSIPFATVDEEISQADVVMKYLNMKYNEDQATYSYNYSSMFLLNKGIGELKSRILIKYKKLTNFVYEKIDIKYKNFDGFVTYSFTSDRPLAMMNALFVNKTKHYNLSFFIHFRIPSILPDNKISAETFKGSYYTLIFIFELINNKTNIETIEEYAFADSPLEIDFKLPNGITYIGENVFFNSRGLKNLYIPESVNFIGSTTFNKCGELEQIIVDKKNRNYATHTDGALYTKNFSEIIKYPEGIYRYITIKKITGPTMHQNTVKIGDYAFSNIPNISTIYFSKKIRTIGNYAFANSVNLSFSTLDLGICELKYKLLPNVTHIGEYAFSNTGIRCINMPDTITYLSNGIFADCKKLINIILPKNCKSIGSNAFFNCNKLQSIIIPETVTEIGDDAFLNCTGLTSIIIPKNTIKIGKNAFSNSGLTTIIFKGELPIMGDNAFDNIGANFPINIYTSWNNNEDFNRYTNKDDKITFINLNIYLYTTNGSKINKYNDYYSNDIIIPQTINDTIITIIGSSAFSEHKELKNVIIPSTIININAFAFQGCTGLTNIIIPNSVDIIGKFAFQGCTSLTSIIIPYSVTLIDSGAFGDCVNIKTIIFEGDRPTINMGAFEKINADVYHFSWSNKTFTNVIMGKGKAKFIDMKCNIIPNGLIRIKSNAFKDCNKMKSIIIPDTVTDIGSRAFNKCSSLNEIIFKGNLPNIYNDAFYNISNNINVYKKTWSDKDKEYLDSIIETSITYNLLSSSENFENTKTSSKIINYILIILLIILIIYLIYIEFFKNT